MPPPLELSPDYLVLGHLTLDQTPAGAILGGTAAYAALTARAHELRAAVVTSCSDDLDFSALSNIDIERVPSAKTTVFRNIDDGRGRRQHLLSRAGELDLPNVPQTWRAARIVHLAPVAGEVSPEIAARFPDDCLMGITPQGWMRRWDAAGRVAFTSWNHAAVALDRADAVVVSLEDVAGDELEVDRLAAATRLLVATEGPRGARVYWNGDVRRFAAADVEQVDPTGAGDIFAASFLIRLHQTRDPWEAARYANVLASRSVSRPGIGGVPSHDEVQQAAMVWGPAEPSRRGSPERGRRAR